MNEFNAIHEKTIQFKLMLTVLQVFFCWIIINTQNLGFIESALMFSIRVYYIQRLKLTRHNITS